MKLYERIKDKKEKIVVVGLGYVGLPLAIAFGKVADVVGFDISEYKIEKYNKGEDVTKEIGNDEIKKSSVFFTSDEVFLKNQKLFIVTVPTPINHDKTPDLKPIIEASEIIGRNITQGSLVVYESTVYPGVTEEICAPILEKISGLKCGVDFKIGYSPERINPGDKNNKLETIVKVVSGIDEEALEDIANIYKMIIKAGVHKAESIKVAEAAKVIENSQRDINIAFMNELSIIFNMMGIDTKAVIDAASTKWNFARYSPGLVGGHCIGVDPYYFIYRAEELGYHSQIILSGRRINDGMGKFVAENTVKNLIKAGKQILNSNVAIFGISFKENCPDCRNTKVIDIINELREYGVNTKVIDPVVDPTEVWDSYGIKLNKVEELEQLDGIIIAVAHEEFLNISLKDLKKLYRKPLVFEYNEEIAATSEINKNKEVLIDVKGIYDKKNAEENNFIYWRL